MKKDDFLMAGATFLIALMMAGTHATLDQSLTEALTTGHTVLRSAVEHSQALLAGFELAVIAGIAWFIRRDIRRTARTAS